MNHHLATCATLPELERLIRRFYLSEEWRVDPQTLALLHPKKPTPTDVRVVRFAQGYIFQAVGRIRRVPAPGATPRLAPSNDRQRTDPSAPLRPREHPEEDTGVTARLLGISDPRPPDRR